MHCGNRRRQRQKENDDVDTEAAHQRFNSHDGTSIPTTFRALAKRSGRASTRCRAAEVSSDVDFGNNWPQRKPSATKHRGRRPCRAAQSPWVLKGKMEFRLGSEQRICGQGDVIVIPGGTEHEAWFREDTEVIDFFAPPREDFLLGGKPAYMSEG